MSGTSLEHDFRIDSAPQLYRATISDREVARAEMCGGEWWIDVADEVFHGLGIPAETRLFGGLRQPGEQQAHFALELIGRLYSKAVRA